MSSTLPRSFSLNSPRISRRSSGALWIGLLVHAEDPGLMGHHQLGGYHLVGGQHEFLDEACATLRSVAGSTRSPRLAEHHIGLG
jgi:hypothetical protein